MSHAPTIIDLPAIKQRTWVSEVSYTPTNLISYNISIGVDGSDLRRCWENHPNFHVLPTFGFIAVVDIMGKVTASMPEFLPNFMHHNHVHGEHYLEQYNPFPKVFTGVVLESNAKVIDVVNRGKGVTITVGITTCNKATGDKICYNEWTSFIRQVPGHGASASTRAQAIQLPNEPPQATRTHETTPSQSALYRATTTEWNPMHISPSHAKEGGFEAPILSGSCTIGIGVRHIIDALAGADVSRFKSVKLRLHLPVIIGEEIQTQMWVGDYGPSVQRDNTAKGVVQKVLYKQVVVDKTSGKEKLVISNAVVELWEQPAPKGRI